MSLTIGDTVPEFKLNDQFGNTFYSKEYLGKQPLVIYFYPKNFTPGCTKEACSFRDKYEDFEKLSAKVVGISKDSETSHKKFANKYNLPFTLLADPQGKVKKMFGVKNNFLGLLPGRVTYVFDYDGKLRYTFDSVNATPHIEKSLKYLEKLV